MKSFFLCSFLIILVACSSEHKKPDYKLSEEQFAKLLFDIHFADVILTDLTIEQRDSLKSLYWTKMAGLYQLTEPEFREEIRKLESDPEKLKLVLDKVKMLADSIP